MRIKETARLARIGVRLAAVAAIAVLAACKPAEDSTDNDAADTDSSIVNLPSVPRPTPVLDRAALLMAVAEAASAKAGGSDDSAAQRDLDGRQFEIRIRFGCRGPAPDLREAMFGWTRDEDGTLRLRATPTISRDNDLVDKVAGEEIEEVEGFWVPRPWLLSTACPTAAAASAPDASTDEVGAVDTDAARPTGGSPSRSMSARGRTQRSGGVDVQETRATPSTGPRIGIAHFFTAAEPRTQRRSNRPYEAVKSLPPEQLVGAQGFNLVLSGRLRALLGKGVIHCVVSSPDAPPDCILSADIDRVWIEQPGARTPLAEWGEGG